MQIILMLSYLIFIALIIEISATLLMLTGLDKKIARYQAISMLTNTGFTTDEAKLILDHPIRRRLSGFLILFGAFSLAVIISILSALLSNDIHLFQVGLILSSAAILLFFLKTKHVYAFLKKKLKADLRQSYPLGEMPIKDVLYFHQDDFLVNVTLLQDSKWVNEKCQNLIQKEAEDIFLLLIKRGNEILRKNLDEECVQAGDVLYVYGNKKEIKEKFHYELEQAEEQEKKQPPASIG